jgi:protein-tyrosine phosphatase
MNAVSSASSSPPNPPDDVRVDHTKPYIWKDQVRIDFQIWPISKIVSLKSETVLAAWGKLHAASLEWYKSNRNIRTELKGLDANHMGEEFYPDRKLIASGHPNRGLEKHTFRNLLWIRCPLIVDLSNHPPQYVPTCKDRPGGSDALRIELAEEKNKGSWKEYNYNMFVAQSSRVFERIHVSDWPDGYIIPIATLDELCVRIENSSQPMVFFHCDGGYGRTGILITALIIRRRIREGMLTQSNFFEALHRLLFRLREERSNFFVTNGVQFELLCHYGDVLLLRKAETGKL